MVLPVGGRKPGIPDRSGFELNTLFSGFDDFRDRLDPGVDLGISQSLRGSPTGPYVAPSAIVLPEDFGARANVFFDSGEAINDAVAQAAATGFGETGAVLGFLYGRYRTSVPIVLPRTGTNPQDVIHVIGRNYFTSALQAMDTFPTGRALIEWEETTARIWHVRIADLRLHLGNVDKTMAIHMKRNGSTNSSTGYLLESLQLNLENIIILGSNQYHEVFIKLETGLRIGSIRNLYGNPSPGSVSNYQTILLQTDTDHGGVTPGAGQDGGGVGYAKIDSMYMGVRSGGFGRLFKGRMHSTVWSVGLSQGVRSQPNIELINSASSRLEDIRFEGYGEQPQILIKDSYYITINDFGLGTPDAQDPAWAATTSYALGDRVVSTGIKSGSNATNKKIFVCTTAGTSGGSEPNWPTSGTVNDGSVVWEVLGDAVGNGLEIRASTGCRISRRPAYSGNPPFSNKLVKVISIDADSQNNVCTDIVVATNSATGDAGAAEVEILATPDKHNLISGYASSGSTRVPFVVGWHPAYPEIVRPPKSITANHTADIAEKVINANATSGAITVSLPSAVGIAGKTYVVRKSDASVNAVTVDPNGSQTVNGSSTHVLSSQYDTVTIVSDGSNWVVT